MQIRRTINKRMFTSSWKLVFTHFLICCCCCCSARTDITGNKSIDNSGNITDRPLVRRGQLLFSEPDHEPRIYVAAPSGMHVMKMRAYIVNDPNAVILFRLHEDPLQKGDAEYFKVHIESGNLTTKRYIDWPVGSMYHIIVAAYNNRETEYINISVHVTEYNKHPPHFRTQNYKVDIELITAVGTAITRVHAADNDEQAYNAEVYYYIQSHTNIISINRTTGIVSLRESLSPRYRDLVFTIVAYDGGSPRRQTKTKLTLTIKIISAPRDIGVEENGDRWAMLCWLPPTSGDPLGYIIYITSMTDFMPHISSQHNVSKEELGLKGDRICTSLTDLESWSDFKVMIAGWNFRETGMLSEAITFDTRVNRTCYSVNNSEYKCSCLAGFFGENCSMFNPCSSMVMPCENGGTCTSIADNQYDCKCRPGYYGTSCEHFNPCSLTPCMNDAECYNLSTVLYGCTCRPGYTGKLCELDIDECVSSPCKNGGKCVDGIADFKCTCLPGFTGVECEIDIDDCASFPCENGATCEDSVNNFECKCPVGFKGRLCDVAFRQCQSDSCNNSGTCIDHTGGYSCICSPGYEGNYCEEETDECTAWPCINGGSCTDSFNDYICHCLPGFTGKRCETDIDLCASNPCKNDGICIDNTSIFMCRCPAGYSGAFCELKDHCPAEVLTTNRGIFRWPKIEFGHTLNLECPYGLTSNVTILASEHTVSSFIPNYNHYFNWSKDIAARYQSSSALLKSSMLNKDKEYSSAIGEAKTQRRIFLEKHLRLSDDGKAHAVRTCLLLNRSAVWGDVLDDLCKEEDFTNAEELCLQLQNLTKIPSQISSDVFLEAVNQVQHILVYALSDRSIAHSLVSIVSNMLEVNDSIVQEADKTGNTSRSLINAIDTFTRDIQLQPNSVIKLSSPNLAVKISSIDVMETVEGITYSPEYSDTESAEMMLQRKKQVRIHIPQEAVRKAATDGSVRVQFVSYINQKLFLPHEITFRYNDECLLQTQVITASLGRTPLHNLTEPLVFKYQGIYDDHKELCVYWDADSMKWSTAGITTNLLDGWIYCESTHLTAFSVILIPESGRSITAYHKVTLITISYIGAVLSITGLLLTILTYSMFRCLNKDRSGKILLNLCVSLLLMNVSYLLLSVQETISFHKINLCIMVAVSVHYFVLTSLAWMLVEAVNMYQLLITAFAPSEAQFMVKRIILAWGLPLCVIAGTISYTGIEYYKYKDTELCIFSPPDVNVYYATYLGPACFILLVNTLVFLMISCVLCQRRTIRNTSKNHCSVTGAQVRGAFTVMTLLGITWVFGFFAIGKFRLTFQYVFNVTNSLQGLIIFVVRCLQYSEARNAWIRFLRTGELKKHHDMKTGGTSFVSHHTNSRSQPTRGMNVTNTDSVDRLLWEVIRSRSNRKHTQSMRTEAIRPSCNVVYSASLTLPRTNAAFNPNGAYNTTRSRSLHLDNNISKEGDYTSWQFLVAVSTAAPVDQGCGIAEYSPKVSLRQQIQQPPPALHLSISSPEWLHSSQTMKQAMTILNAHSDSDIVPAQTISVNSHSVLNYPPRRESNETSTGTESQSSTLPGPSTTSSVSTSPTISPTSSCYDTQIWSQVPLVDANSYEVPKRIHCEELL